MELYLIKKKKVNAIRNARNATEMQDYFTLQLWFCMVKASYIEWVQHDCMLYNLHRTAYGIE